MKTTLDLIVAVTKSDLLDKIMHALSVIIDWDFIENAAEYQHNNYYYNAL